MYNLVTQVTMRVVKNVLSTGSWLQRAVTYPPPPPPPQESELECIQLQANVEQLGEEKERVLNSLIEAESVRLCTCNTAYSSELNTYHIIVYRVFIRHCRVPVSVA